MFLGAIGRSISELNIASHPLESVDYQCSGTEQSLGMCSTSDLASCQLAATVQCQGRYQMVEKKEVNFTGCVVLHL